MPGNCATDAGRLEFLFGGRRRGGKTLPVSCRIAGARYRSKPFPRDPIRGAPMKARVLPFALAFFLVSGALAALAAEDTAGRPKAPPVDPREVHLTGLIQLSRGGENAEAYWSPDSRELVFQSSRPPYACDQIFRVPADGSGPATLVSTGKGRTTCSYFLQGGQRVLYSSTHLAGPECPPPPDRSHGYVWSIDPHYEVFTARPDGSDLVRLTENQAYDAETTVCPKDGSLIF